MDADYGEPKKGRQGRSKASRLRDKQHVEDKKKMEEHENKFVQKCMECMEENRLIEDHHSGDLICENCGVIQADGGLGFSDKMFSNLKMSKMYQREVHFQQRIASLLSTDPALPESVIEEIGKEIELNLDKYKGTTETFGKVTFSQVLSKLHLDRRLSRHWIQIRKRLGYKPSVPPINGSTLSKIKLRYQCISRAFSKCLYAPNHSSKQHHLQRKNILNLNYVMVQLLRLEDQQSYKQLACFFPQLASDNQPQLNNKRWKILMEYCSTNFEQYSDPKVEENHDFHWEYKPLETQHIIQDIARFY